MNKSPQKLKIAQVCPLWEQVPPKGYGGIEQVVSWLTEELVQRGHEVTLLASGDSQTAATLKKPCQYALRHDSKTQGDSWWDLNRKHTALEQLQLKWLYSHAETFDIIHSHLEMNALSFAALSATPTVHTMHMEIIPEAGQLFSQYADQNFISISNAQREPCPTLNYLSTVYNAIDLNDLKFYPKSQAPDYLAFVGRLSPDKGVHLAIEISQRTGIPLKIAGKCNLEVAKFYEEEVKPKIDGQHIQYLGEVSQQAKNELLGNAMATLFPITWREPFGLVMIESIACGTPVLGMSCGSVPEVIISGKTGYICDSIEEMIHCLPKVKQLSRSACRADAEARFSVRRMVDDYEACYHKILQRHGS